MENVRTTENKKPADPKNNQDHQEKETFGREPEVKDPKIPQEPSKYEMGVK
jgi:hypothetical protein